MGRLTTERRWRRLSMKHSKLPAPHKLPDYITIEELSKMKCNYINHGEVEYDFNQGANFILGKLKEKLDRGEEITKEWCNEPIPIRRQGSILAMHDYLDGAENIMKRIAIFVYHGGKVDMNSWLFAGISDYLYKEGSD